MTRSKTPRAGQWSRRQLIATFGLAAPLVPLLGEERARAAEKPKRLVIIQWTNGALESQFWPSGTETSFTLPECLKPLEPFKNDILVLRGLKLQACREDPRAGAGHQSLPHLLTGAIGAPTDITGGDPGSRVIGNSISVDQHVARAFAQKNLTPVRSLELSVQRGNQRPTHGFISFLGPAKSKSYPDAITPIDSPYDAFKRLFEGGAIGAETLERVKRRRHLVLDVLAPELKALHKHLGSEDRKLLDEHLTAVESMQKELNATLPAAPGADAPGACRVEPLPGGVDPRAAAKYPDLVRMQLENLVAAFRCDVTRVGSLMLSNSANTRTTFTWLGQDFLKDSNPKSGVGSGSSIGHHEIAHAAGNRPDPLKTRVDRWFVEQFAYLLKRLKETSDPAGGTLLDNTVVLFTNHMDNGAGHGVEGDIPMILGGSAGGHFKTGRYLRWTSRLAHNGLLASLATAVGVPTSSFGDGRYNTTGQIEPRLRG